MSIVAARATVFFCFLLLTQLLLLPIVITNNLHILLYNLRAVFNKASTLNAIFLSSCFSVKVRVTASLFDCLCLADQCPPTKKLKNWNARLEQGDRQEHFKIGGYILVGGSIRPNLHVIADLRLNECDW